MVDPITLAALAAGGYGAVRGLSAFAARRYGRPIAHTDPGRPPPTTVEALTEDGWRLPADHHRPAGPPRGTVILCHGLGVNRTFFDMGPETSLARHLAGSGFEVFNVDLRGGGGSAWTGPGEPPEWLFEDHVTRDVPALLDMARRFGASDRVHWVGHSMGGLLLLAWLGLHPDDTRVASGTIVGSPVDIGKAHWSVRAVLSTAEPLTRVTRLPSSIAGWMAPLMPAAGVRTHLIDFGHFDGPTLRRALYQSRERIHTPLVRQFTRFFNEGVWLDADGVDYRTRLPRITTPMYFIAGAGDRPAPPESVIAGHRAVGSSINRYAVLGTATGCAIDYCHGGLMGARTAPDEVYPRIAGWLASRSDAPAPPTSGDGRRP